MHDIRALRADPAAFDAALNRRAAAPETARVLALDAELRATLTELQEGQARRNEASRAIGAAKAARDEGAVIALMDEVAALKERMPALEERARVGEAAVRDALLAIPNAPAPDVPEGADEHGNVEVHRRGVVPAFDFAPLEHDVLAAPLGYDPDAAAAIAGARFAVLKGPLARLHRALGQFMLDTQIAAGYVEVAPPLLVRSAAMLGTGQLPKFGEDAFHTTDDRWLIPTAEVSLTNLVRERILAEGELPLRFVALTPCFRQEAGSAGKDTRGLIRQHQFEKVEMVSITTPDASEAEHERMTQCAEAILDALGLPYRRMLLCAGDMGFSARKTFDLEVWLPGQGRYREISSCSNCGDFQARRMDARYRPAGAKGTGFVHTLNGSGLAVGRTLVAVLENYQQADGSVEVPNALRPWMGGVEVLRPA
jgi:seryl-tRNA synthetase